MKNALIGLFAALAALSSLAEVTRDTEWYKIPDKTKVGAVVDLSDTSGKADQSALDSHVKNKNNPHAVTAVQIYAVPFVEDLEGLKTAVTIGSRTIGESVSPYSLANGHNVTASGVSSHAEGELTTASGNYSHAEGDSTTASGAYSHAEGNETLASGEGSHAEGGRSFAQGNYSHAEGGRSIADGKHSHAEGFGTYTSGTGSHAEGDSTTASGDYSHAEGVNAVASGAHSHAEGLGSTASGRSSHAEGANTVASGDYSHAEGGGSVASGLGSHAEGDSTVASGLCSHAAGFKSRTPEDDDYAFAWNGDDTISERYQSHGSGTFNINPVGGLGGFYIGEKTLTEVIKDSLNGELDPKKWVNTNETVVVNSHAITTYSPTFVDNPPEQLLIKADGTCNFEIYFPDNDSVRELLPIDFDVVVDGDVKKIGKVWTEKITKLPAILTMREPEDKTLLATVQYFD